jgi:hypothetical protein
MAELWGSVVVSVLFWGFANQVGMGAAESHRVAWGAPQWVGALCIGRSGALRSQGLCLFVLERQRQQLPLGLFARTSLLLFVGGHWGG